MNSRIDAIQLSAAKYESAIKDMEQSLTSTSTSTSSEKAKLKGQVDRLTTEITQLTEECTDLDGRSKRQNILNARVWEGKEHGQSTRDFVATLLQKVLELEEKPLLDQAHRGSK